MLKLPQADQPNAEVGHTIWLPRQFAVDGRVAENPVRQLRRDDSTFRAVAEPYARDGIRGSLLTWGENVSTLIVSPTRTIDAPPGIDEVLRTPGGAIPEDGTGLDAGRARTFWISPTPRDVTSFEPEEWDELLSSIRQSWNGRFSFRQERRGNGTLIETGLRPPQIGALHAALAHWTMSDEAATIVMPTGTGKTETMLALLTSQRLKRLLVVVPTAPLRE
jgi:hypothetical protein